LPLARLGHVVASGKGTKHASIASLDEGVGPFGLGSGLVRLQ
jgi:hypothetical protein